MAPIKRSKLLQNAAEQAPVATPKLQNNTKENPVLVDKTNQIATIRALRNRKIYTDSIAKVSKDLFKNGVIQSPRGTSKKYTSTKKLTVPRKSSECFVVLERVDEARNHNKLVYKDISPPGAEKQTLTKKLRKVPKKGLEKDDEAKVTKLVNKDMCVPASYKHITTKRFGLSKGLAKADEAKVNELVNKDVGPPDSDKQTSTKRFGVRKGLAKADEAKVNELVNKDVGAPDSDKQTSTEKLGNTQKTSKYGDVLDRINETKNHKKLVYENVSPSSAEKEKTFTPAKKKLLYNFKGGSGSSDSSSKKHTRRRKPVRKRIKPPNDTSDEENCDVQNVTKKRRMLTACANDSNTKEKQDCTFLHSHTLHSSMNSSVEPLREQNTFSNLSVKSETRKFFKTPVRKELIEMSYFNYTNQKKKKITKSSKALSRKTERSRSYKTKQNTLLYKSYDTGNKLPVWPVLLNENSMQSKMCNVAMNSNSKSSELKPTNGNTVVPSMKSGLQKVQPKTVTALADKTEITNNKLPVKSVLNENRMQLVGSSTAFVSKIPVLKPTTSSTVVPVTKSALEQVHPQKVVAIVSKTHIPNVKTASCTDTVEVMNTDVCDVQDLSAEETSPKVPLTSSQINYKRGGTTFGLNFTLGDSKTDCSIETDKSAATNQVQDTLPSASTASAVPLVGVVKQPQAPPPVGVVKEPQAPPPVGVVKEPQTIPPVGVVKEPQTIPPVGVVKQPQTVPPVGVVKHQSVRDKIEERNYFTAPVRTLDFFERYTRNISRRHRVEGLYVPAAPSAEHFTLENYFGFDEEPEEEFTLSPVKRQSDTDIKAPPLTSTPHISNNKKCTSPQHSRLTVKPNLKKYQCRANVSTSASQINCSQILAGGGCGYKKKTTAFSGSKEATFAVPLLSVPASAAQNKKAFATAGGSMVQSSIIDYMQSASDVPFETSISNIEGDELSVTHTEPPRRSYERPVRKRKHIEHEYMSEEEEEEEEEEPKMNTLSRKCNRSKRVKRSKKQEKIFEKWASNVSSQFEEIDSIALIVE